MGGFLMIGRGEYFNIWPVPAHLCYVFFCSRRRRDAQEPQWHSKRTRNVTTDTPAPVPPPQLAAAEPRADDPSPPQHPQRSDSLPAELPQQHAAHASWLEASRHHAKRARVAEDKRLHGRVAEIAAACSSRPDKVDARTRIWSASQRGSRSKQLLSDAACSM